MTIQADNFPFSYLGNGVTTSFPVNSRFINKTFITVERVEVSTGAVTTLVLDSLGADGYTVQNANTQSSGQITVVTPPSSTQRLNILLNVPATQLTDYIPNDPFPAESHEDALDKLTLLTQEGLQNFGLAMRVNPSDVGVVSTLLPPADALKGLRWNAAETALENYAITNYGDVGGSDLIGFLHGASGSVLRTVGNKLRDVVSVMDFGAIGNGVADDRDACQNAHNSGAKFVLYPAGKTFKWGSGKDGPLVPAGQTVYGYGATIIQPNKGTKTGFSIDPNSSDITIAGFDIRGPWYGTGPGLWSGVTNTITVGGDVLANLTENIGINIRGRWYQREILGYNAAQMGALTDTCFNIKVMDCIINGFGQSGILADRITGFYALRNKITYCGRDGIRQYGVVRGFVHDNQIGELAPGWDGDYPNWNVYGITCTRMQGTVAIPDSTLSISRCTQDVTVSNNKVYNCPTWKCLDNHGSIDIRFTGNKCSGFYIGLGLDQGGTDSNRGIAPPIRNIVTGNVFDGTGATYMRAGIAAYGHDSTTQANDGLVVEGNIFLNCGGNDTDGAIACSNVRNASVTANVIKGAPRSAINLYNMGEDISILGNTIEDSKSYITVTANAVGSGYTLANTTCNVSGGGGTGLKVIPNIVGGQITSYSVIHPGTGYTSAPSVTVSGDGTGATTTVTFNIGYGILVQGSTVRATVDQNNFVNLTQANLRCLSMNAPSGNYGVMVGAQNRYTGTGVTKVVSVANLGHGSLFNRVPTAAIRATSAGAVNGSFGCTIAKAGTGLYDITLNVPAAVGNNLLPIATDYAAFNRVFASVTSTSVIRVTTQDSAGAAADAAFTLVVYDVAP